jgi:hypothetical protein
MAIKKLSFISILVFIITFVNLSACEKQAGDPHSEVLKDQDQRSLYEKTYQNHPPIDPTLCKDNPEGYLYFTVGKDVFRSNKRSGFIIVSVRPESNDEGNLTIKTSGVLEGCEENPYKMEKLIFNTNFRAGYDDIVMDLKIDYIELLDVPSEKYKELTYKLYSMKDFNWSDTLYKDGNYGSRGEFKCVHISESLSRCNKIFLSGSALNNKVGIYVSNKNIYKNIQGLPLVLDCDNWVLGIKCNTFYRIYPTVNFRYSISYKSSELFDETKVIAIDHHFRTIFEKMRVNKSSN